MDPTREDTPPPEEGDAATAGTARDEGALAELETLMSLVGESIRDTVRLLGLETGLVLRTVITMVALGVLLGLIATGIWLAITLMVAAVLYEHTGLGITFSLLAAALLNVFVGWLMVRILKRLAGRLTYPETRLAIRTLAQEAGRTLADPET